MIYSNVLGLIGNTPLLKLNRIKEVNNHVANIYAKLESYNPGGSVKDRISYAMLKDALDRGDINQDTTIIEPTSGNTGIGLAMACSVLNIKLIICMPARMSLERQQIIRAYGARLDLTDSKLGMAGSIAHANELKNKISNSYILDQFSNDSSPLVHYKTTGPEMYNALSGKVDVFVTGIGTGGTITGVAKYLKEQNPNIEVIGVEPTECPFFTKGEIGTHKIQGLGSGFVPDVLDLKYCDKIITVSYPQAKQAANMAARNEGILVGVSSGAILSVASDIASDINYKDKNIIIIFPDDGMKYLSTDLYE